MAEMVNLVRGLVPGDGPERGDGGMRPSTFHHPPLNLGDEEFVLAPPPLPSREGGLTVAVGRWSVVIQNRRGSDEPPPPSHTRWCQLQQPVWLDTYIQIYKVSTQI